MGIYLCPFRRDWAVTAVLVPPCPLPSRSRTTKVNIDRGKRKKERMKERTEWMDQSMCCCSRILCNTITKQQQTKRNTKAIANYLLYLFSDKFTLSCRVQTSASTWLQRPLTSLQVVFFFSQNTWILHTRSKLRFVQGLQPSWCSVNRDPAPSLNIPTWAMSISISLGLWLTLSVCFPSFDNKVHTLMAKSTSFGSPLNKPFSSLSYGFSRLMMSVDIPRFRRTVSAME